MAGSDTCGVLCAEGTAAGGGEELPDGVPVFPFDEAPPGAHFLRRLDSVEDRLVRSALRAGVGDLLLQPVVVLDEALEAVKAFAAAYGKRFPTACGILAKDLGDCLTFYRVPGEMAALALIWATLEQGRLK